MKSKKIKDRVKNRKNRKIVIVEKPKKERYRKITAVMTDTNEGNDSFAEIEKTDVMRVRFFVPFNDERARALVYGQLQSLGFELKDIKEKSEEKWEENFFWNITEYKPEGRDAKQYGKKLKSSEKNREENFYEVMSEMTGYNKKKLKQLGREYVENELFKNGKTLLASPEYKKARIEHAIERNRKYVDKKLNVLNEEITKVYEKSNDLWVRSRKIAVDAYKLSKELEKRESTLNSFEHIGEYLGGPFMLMDPKFWKDQIERLTLAFKNAVAVTSEVLIDREKTKNKENIEGKKEMRDELYDEGNQIAKETRESESDKINEERAEEREKNKLIQKAINKAQKDPENFEIILKNDLANLKEQLSEIKLNREGFFQRVDEWKRIDNEYKDVLDSLDFARGDINEKMRQLRKKKGIKTEEKQEEMDKLKEKKNKIAKEKERLNNNKFEEKYGDKETRRKRVRSSKEDEYLRTLANNKGNEFASYKRLIEREEERISKIPELSKEDQENLNAFIDFKKDHERRLANAKAKKDVDEIGKLENSLKSVTEAIKDIIDDNEGKKEEPKQKENKQIDKNSEIKPKETPRSEKETERDNLTLEEEIKALRGSKESVKAYHSIYDEQNMMDDLQDKGLSYQEARAKTDEYYKKYDEAKRVEEIEKAKKEIKKEANKKLEDYLSTPADKESLHYLKVDVERTCVELQDFVRKIESADEVFSNSYEIDDKKFERKEDKEEALKNIEDLQKIVAEIKNRDTSNSNNNLADVLWKKSSFDTLIEKKQMGNVFEKENPIKVSEYKDFSKLYGEIKRKLEDKFKPKIEPMLNDSRRAYTKLKNQESVVDIRKKMEENYKKEKELEKEYERKKALEKEKEKQKEQEKKKINTPGLDLKNIKKGGPSDPSL